MKRPIDADAAIDHFRRIIDATNTDSGYDEGFIDALEFCISTLSTMPAAEPFTDAEQRICLSAMESELEVCKEIDNENAAVAKPGSVIQTELCRSVKCDPGCFAWCQHDDGDFGQRIVPDLAEQVSLGVVVIENGLGGEGSFDGVHVSILQFGDDLGGGDVLRQVDHNREVVVQDVQRRYEASSADFCCPLTGVLLVVDDGFQAGNVLDCFSDDGVAAGLQVVPEFAVFRIENHKAGQDFRAQLLRQIGREQGQLIGCAKGVEQWFSPP